MVCGYRLYSRFAVRESRRAGRDLTVLFSRSRLTKVCPRLALGLLLVAAPAKSQTIDPALARQYFQEAEANCKKDNGRLWGVSLCGPILFADPETRAVVANQADGEGRLERRDDVYVGKLPDAVGVANTATQWAGVAWTMVMWPLPEFRQPRVRLLMHECFHRIQSQIGLSPEDSSNNHLDTRDGRIWLEMEWRALEHAIWSQGPARHKAIADALYFRAYRRSLFPGGAARENALELNEGLAEYTGLKLSSHSPEEFAMLADSTLRGAPDRHPNFVRSFAYVSGPAYGFLLDAAEALWRRALTPQSDLGQLLAHAYEVQMPEVRQAEAVQRAGRYDGDEVMALEIRRDQARQAKLTEARKRFVDGPVLILPVGSQFNYGFDPNNVFSIDEDSTVYLGEVQVSDEWGILKASGGFMLVRRTGHVVRVQVPAPADANRRPIKGDGWTLDLQEGWQVAPGDRKGDLMLKKLH